MWWYHCKNQSAPPRGNLDKTMCNSKTFTWTNLRNSPRIISSLHCTWTNLWIISLTVSLYTHRMEHRMVQQMEIPTIATDKTPRVREQQMEAMPMTKQSHDRQLVARSARRVSLHFQNANENRLKSKWMHKVLTAAVAVKKRAPQQVPTLPTALIEIPIPRLAAGACPTFSTRINRINSSLTTTLLRTARILHHPPNSPITAKRKTFASISKDSAHSSNNSRGASRRLFRTSTNSISFRPQSNHQTRR
mmetsp:Transcript_1741/g.6124  ORF Transcript_1741/g.6124 Transcript_1741/m.6124 type:complete len:248 (+) Transcript_1741:1745-2488(+)